MVSREKILKNSYYGLLVLPLSVFFGSVVDVSGSDSYSVNDFDVTPINIIESSSKPKAMLSVSNDHQLYFKAYNDFSDLDEDGVVDTTYTHSFDYYGYFDSYKCYEYDTTDKRFEPRVNTADKYCSGDWSGNFLNWATMSRIDTMRKVLFGGHRRVDKEGELVVLERAYLPHDAHSWAKHYDGDDIEKLTPFQMGTDYDCDAVNTAGCMVDGKVDEKKIGITIGNTTDIDFSAYSTPKPSHSAEYYLDPPLIKTVKGNFSLWATSERWQVLWKVGPGEDIAGKSVSGGTNGNDPSDSGIYAYSDSPVYATDGIGEKDYIARVVVCDDSVDPVDSSKTLIGTERCKKYPNGDYKPIGLLHTYGEDTTGDDPKKMEFGMVAGSYSKHAAGGVVIRPSGNFADEIDPDTGIFKLVYVKAGGPETSKTASEGLVNSWSLFRIIRYDAEDGLYNDTDNCPWKLTDPADVTADNACKNWGNPFSEIYYQSLHYLAGMGVVGDYRSNMSVDMEGLVTPESLSEDPLDSTDYCAPLNIININASVSSYDADHIDSSAYGPTKLWDPDVLPGTGLVAEMADYVGYAEGLYDKKYFYGEQTVIDPKKGDSDDQMCTAKTLTSLGSIGGVCPEAPRLKGSYAIAGLAYYAHTEDIRPDTRNPQKIEGLQTVDTYSVALASGTPVVRITDPSDSTKTIASIIPACRLTAVTPNGACAIVDFKVLEDSGTSGKVFVVWENSEQGGDFDQDLWGTITYSADLTAKTLTVETKLIDKSAGGSTGFGYILNGTTADGYHAHSGYDGYKSKDVADSGPDCTDADGCQVGDAASSITYTLGTSTAELLKDPLWYAAKWGGFTDSNGNKLPDLDEEWDKRNNSDWTAGSDGIPDHYFYAVNPRKLEEALERYFNAILERTSSGTAAAVVASNVRGEGALYQAYYEPLKKDGDTEARWIGTVQALWLDSFGYTRQDCSPPTGYTPGDSCPATPLECGDPNGEMDDYCVDNVVETFYDEFEARTRVKIFNSTSPDRFVAYSMQGVVKSYDTGVGSGAVVMVPNSMEGVITESATGWELSPYTITGKINTYVPGSDNGVVNVDISSVEGPSGGKYSSWQIDIYSSDELLYTSTTNTPFSSSDEIELLAVTGKDITISPVDDALAYALRTEDGYTAPELTIVLKTKNVVGKGGDTFKEWDIQCLDDTDITGTVLESGGLSLSDSLSSAFSITDGDFTTCNYARVSTYNLQGPGGTYEDWQVENLSTLLGKGTSESKIALANSGEKSLVVSPVDDWLQEGDRIKLTNFNYSTAEMYQINYLWNGREELTSLTESRLTGNRDPFTDQIGDSTTTYDRYIMTWIDDNLDGIVDSGEYVPFEAAEINGVNYNFFDVADEATAENIVNYIRGIEVTGYRNRTIPYSSGDSPGVMRLGDIINSTPTVVGSPQEAFDLLYYDTSYQDFRKQYIDRRVVVYTGANDGLLHAFNGGFYQGEDSSGTKVVRYVTAGPAGEVAHPLGAELWAYAPKNLLSHLQWLTDKDNYKENHVYYVDGKPRVFDANIFADDATHPHGWGTVMVVGMGLGGGAMAVDADTDQDNDVDGDDSTTLLKSAYIILDITDPEQPPKLLGEITIPDQSFSTVYPAVASFKDVDGTSCSSGTAKCNSWYLIFGNGPDNKDVLTLPVGYDIENFESTQTGKFYMFDLAQLTGNSSGPVPISATWDIDAQCDVIDHNTSVVDSTVKYKMVSCDTGVANSFMGTPMVVDWELDSFANTTYFGLIGDDSATSGRVMKLDFANAPALGGWSEITTFFNGGASYSRPVVGQPVPAFDNLKNKWLFFGTGRFYSIGDKFSTTDQYLYGVKETGAEVTHLDLLDVTDVEVFADGDLENPVTSTLIAPATDVLTFDDLEEEIDSNAGIHGWRITLPPITGTVGIDPSTRNTTRSALLGGVLLTSVFQPNDDECEAEGLSRLYGLYYKTGTAFPSPSVLGASIVTHDGEVKYRSNKFIELGRGVATAPALHSGAGSGDDTIKVYTQLSTGDILQVSAETVEKVRTGKVSWSDNP